jgi:hypothetical protein
MSNFRLNLLLVFFLIALAFVIGVLVSCGPTTVRQPSMYVQVYKKDKSGDRVDYWLGVKEISKHEDGSYTLYLRDGRQIEIPSDFSIIVEK